MATTMAATEKIVLGSIAFVVFWILAVFPSVPFLPIGITAGSLLGAMLMVVFQVLSPDKAYAAVDLPVLGLLFGTMVVSAFLERADMFVYLGKLLQWKRKGPKDLLLRISLIAAVSSALFTNDTACVVLTEFVLKVARQQNLPPYPFLLALASSANIGSAATPIGNPQNLVIAMQSKIGFDQFVLGVFPAMLVGVCVNVLILLGMYWNVLSERKDEEVATAPEMVAEDAVVSHRFSHLDSLNSQDIAAALDSLTLGRELAPVGNNSSHFSGRMNAIHPSLDLDQTRGTDAAQSRRTDGHDSSAIVDQRSKWKRMIWKACVYLVTLGMLVCLLMGLNMSWTALTAALVLLGIDFKDARPSLEKVSYSLLVFFCGMFITMEGFNETGIPNKFWEFVEPFSRINHVGGIAVLACVVILLSNLVSNVPSVLLLGAKVAASAAMISPSSEKKAWLYLAWVASVAGNLTILGSAANLIVCEQARRSKDYGYNLSFWTHLWFGVPSTLIVTAIGLPLVRG